MDVKPFSCVQVDSFFIAMQYLHDIVHGAAGVIFFIKVFRETGSAAIVSENCHVLLVSRGESVYQSVRRMSYCSRDSLVCILPIVKIYRGWGFCGRVDFL